MIKDKLLQSRREQGGINAGVLASFIGITYESYCDLESDLDDLTELTLIEAMRLTMALGFHKPSELLDLAPVAKEPLKEIVDKGYVLDISKDVDKPKLVLLPNEENLAKSIRRHLPVDLRSIEDELGWSAEGVEGWLSDEESMGEMAIAALIDVCIFVNISFIDTIDRYYGILAGTKAI